MARGCALIDSRIDTAKIGSDGRVEVHRARLLAVFGGQKTFPHGLGQTRKSARLNGMSVLPPTADVVGPPRHVRVVPTTAIKQECFYLYDCTVIDRSVQID